MHSVKVKLRVNLGTADTAKYGVEKPEAGEIVDVSEDAAEEMIAAGLAEHPEGTKLHAVPHVAVKSEKKPHDA